MTVPYFSDPYLACVLEKTKIQKEDNEIRIIGLFVKYFCDL